MNKEEQKAHFDKFKKYFRDIWIEAEISIGVPLGSRRHYRKVDLKTGDSVTELGFEDQNRVDGYAKRVYDSFTATGKNGAEFTLRWNRIVKAASKLSFPKFTIEMVMDGMSQMQTRMSYSSTLSDPDYKLSLENIQKGYDLEEKRVEEAKESRKLNPEIAKVLPHAMRMKQGMEEALGPMPENSWKHTYDSICETFEDHKSVAAFLKGQNLPSEKKEYLQHAYEKHDRQRKIYIEGLLVDNNCDMDWMREWAEKSTYAGDKRRVEELNK